MATLFYCKREAMEEERARETGNKFLCSCENWRLVESERGQWKVVEKAVAEGNGQIRAKGMVVFDRCSQI
jgi:hypothetical protein